MKQIDAKVDETLQAAAKLLRQLKIERDDEKTQISIVEERLQEVSCTSVETRGTISIGTVHRSSSKQPKATIRTPTDSAKSRNKFYFPPATVGGVRTPTTMVSSYTETSSCDMTSTTVPSTPELFPNAVYIPAGKKVSEIKPVMTRRAKASSSTQSVYRMEVQKLAIQPLDDISYLKCRGVKKSKPDSMFPSATYTCGTGKANLAMSPVTSTVDTSSSSCMSTAGESSLAYLPMEFVSADGRVKMLLKAVEEKKIKKTSSSKKKDSEGEFPIVPKQLQSSTKLKTMDEKRMKFMTKIPFLNSTLDLSGILNGAKKGNLVINGQHYSV